MTLWRYIPRAAVGLAVGGALAFAFARDADPADGRWRPTMVVGEFDTQLRLSRIARGPAVLRDVVVYPEHAGTNYVSGEFLTEPVSAGRYRPFQMTAPASWPGETGDVRAHLARFPVNYTYAWWAGRTARAWGLLVAGMLATCAAWQALPPKSRDKQPAPLPDPQISATAPLEEPAPSPAADPATPKEYRGVYYPVEVPHDQLHDAPH